MTKSIKNILVIVVAFILMLSLTGCGFASKAEKIKEKWDAGEQYTLEDIKDKLGDPTSETIIRESGFVVWVKGCDNLEEAKEKWDSGETMPALVVTIISNRLVSIKYIENATENDAR